MKELFISLILTLVLIAFFSSIYTPFEPVSSVGYGDKKPGDSGMVLPGKGSKPAEIMSESPQNKTSEKEVVSKIEITTEHKGTKL